METYWVPGVNDHGQYGRRAFAEFTDVYEMQTDFEARVEAGFTKMIEKSIQADIVSYGGASTKGK